MSIHLKITGSVQGVYLGLETGNMLTTLQSPVVVTFAGFDGDQHAGLTRKSDSRTPSYPRGTEIRNDRQVSIVSVEELAQIAINLGLPQLQAEWLGANLLLTGIARLSTLPPDTHLYFSGGVVLVVTGENHPCTQAGRSVQRSATAGGPVNDQLATQFPRAAKGLRGVVACVEHPGIIDQGESVEAHIPKVRAYRLD